MARIPDAEIERIKAEVSLVRLVESSGVKLQKRGADMVGCCPFHADDTPSLSVSEAKNLFRCFGCDAGGGPIDWVMKREGVSFRHAVELLRDGAPIGASAAPVKASTVRRLAPPVSLDADDQALLDQVLGYYHETLKASPEGLAYLQSRGLSGELVDRFRLGLANRTLGLRLPEKNRKAGADLRGRLERVGLYRDTGHEHFAGSLVVPILDEGGRAQEVYGRKIRSDLRPGTPLHLYLPGPHKGVWNLEGIAAAKGEVILAEALIDAMTFWSAGFRNVTATYGTGGFTDDHMAVFRAHGVTRVLIAFDRDDAGDRGAAEIAERLMGEGIDCFRILFPKGMDANSYALKVTPAARSLGVLIRKAEWLGNGRAPALTSAPRNELEAALAVPASPSLAAEPQAPELAEPSPEPCGATPMPAPPIDDPVTGQSEHELTIVLGDRRYRVRGWKKPLNPESLKVNLLVHRGDRFHVDTFDLYSAKARAAFVKAGGIELGEAEDVLKHDLGRVLLKIEALQDAELSAALTRDERPSLSDEEREAALDLLRSPDLVARILADFSACGVVGEATNVLTGYLACVSRLLDKPLALIIQSSSAAGKSSLMDAVLAMVPADAQVRYSAMTGQSLFYMGETNLKHRILAIAEEEGAQSASYALKLLQSDGAVTIASTGKDPTTGHLTTHEYRVEGPVMLFLTTTAIDLDEELLNRCMVLTVDEGREQTRAIHALQRSRETLAGLLARAESDAVIALHRNAQTLLEGLAVVNPFADALTFMDDKTRARRDHMKYLTLIRSIALLHQHQRRIRTVTHRGRPLRYIEVEAGDIALANALASEVLGRTLDELPPQTRRLLGLVHDWVRERCAAEACRRSDFRFTRRQVRALTGWGDTQTKLHLGRLAELEYLLAHRVKAGQGYEYELLWDGEGQSGERFMIGLSDPGKAGSDPAQGAETHAYDGDRSGVNGRRSGQKADRSGGGRPLVGPRSGGGRVAKTGATPEDRSAFSDHQENAPKTHIGLNGKNRSYPEVIPASAGRAARA
jgi:DNA primase